MSRGNSRSLDLCQEFLVLRRGNQIGTCGSNIPPGASVNPLDRPTRMLHDERFGISCRDGKRPQIPLVAHISESDANISQKPATLDPLDRRPPKYFSKLRVVEPE